MKLEHLQDLAQADKYQFYKDSFCINTKKPKNFLEKIKSIAKVFARPLTVTLSLFGILYLIFSMLVLTAKASYTAGIWANHFWLQVFKPVMANNSFYENIPNIPFTANLLNGASQLAAFIFLVKSLIGLAQYLKGQEVMSKPITFIILAAILNILPTLMYLY